MQIYKIYFKNKNIKLTFLMKYLYINNFRYEI